MIAAICHDSARSQPEPSLESQATQLTYEFNERRR
jgi:hypothetical protein